MKIRNASVYTSYGNFEQLDVLIHDGMIQDVTPKDGLKNIEDDVTVDGTGMYLIPALPIFISTVVWDMISVTAQKRPSRPWPVTRPAMV